MTTPPKAARFRIRTGTVPAPRRQATAAAPDDGFGNDPFPTAEQDMTRPPDGQADEAEIEAIRAEGLSGRQLRTARRVAMKNGIAATSDHDAVRQLRRRGIDPFRPAAVLQLIERRPAAETAPHLPQTVPQTVPPALPGPRAPALDDAARAREIIEIQRDIIRRRRRNFALLFARLAAFVLLPAAVAGWYYYRIATPLYATKTEFIIQQADAQVGGLGSMFRGTQFATSQDSIAVQGYLQSRDAMLRLDRDLGFKAHFAQDFIDPVQRLAPDATNEAAYRLYRRNVKIGYDPTEGLVRMEVIAADPAVSQKFAEALIGYAEDQVDQLSARLREDQMKGARDSYADAEAKVAAAQDKVLSLQERLGVLDPMSESNAVMSQVATFEVELQKKRLELRQLLDNASPNQARVDGAEGDIARLEDLIGTLRSQLTEGTASTASLAQVSGQLRIAEAELENRQLMLSQALQQLETARIEANRQVRYLETAVSPVAPDEPTYPRAFENTLLALLIFGGIYLMLSLTASILREQATA